MEEQSQNKINPCDPEVFARVWDRVMPIPSPSCPIELVEGVGVVNTAPPPQEPAKPAIIVPPRVETQTVHTHGTSPYLGGAATCDGGTLQAMIDNAVIDSHRYRQLAKRQKNGSKTLMVLANQRKKHGKKLATAYFLISGVNYWPKEPVATVQRTPYPAALRQGFQMAQHSHEGYTLAALETTDRQLGELYLTLAEEMAHHSNLLRYLLEQVI